MDAVHNSVAPIPFLQSSAQPLRALELPGARMSQYINEHEQVYYEDHSIHTFSLYLEGGYQTHRTDTQAQHGGPGRFCLMPAGSYSAWDIGMTQKFVHVYFDDDYIKQLAMQNFDMDPRQVSLPQLTFEQNDSLSALVQHSLLTLDWQQPDNLMLLQHSMQNVLLHLLQAVGLKRIKLDTPLKAGLSPSVKRRLRACVEENYQRQISLGELADVAELSEYHFARMFKLSFAVTPQTYITQYRVDQLQHSLKRVARRGRPDMARLAQEHGFCSQSHMGRVFKQHTGVTPGQFVKSLC